MHAPKCDLHPVPSPNENDNYPAEADAQISRLFLRFPSNTITPLHPGKAKE